MSSNAFSEATRDFISTGLRAIESGRRADMLHHYQNFARFFQDSLAHGTGQMPTNEVCALYDHLFFLLWRSINRPSELHCFNENVVEPFVEFINRHPLSDVPTNRRLRDGSGPLAVAYLAQWDDLSGSNAVSRISWTHIIGHQTLHRGQNPTRVYCSCPPQRELVDTAQKAGVQLRDLSCGGDIVETARAILRQAAADHIDALIVDRQSALATLLFTHRIAPVQVFLEMGFAPWRITELDFCFQCCTSGWAQTVSAPDKCEHLPLISHIDFLVPERAPETIAALRSSMAKLAPDHRTQPDERLVGRNATPLVVYGFFGRMTKVTLPWLKLVERILLKVTNAVCFIGGTGGQNTAVDTFLGSSPVANRILYQPMYVDGHVVGRVLDVFLDTAPFPGGLACLESQAKGVPVVWMESLLKDQWASIQEHRDDLLMSRDEDDFVRIAVDLADPAKRDEASARARGLAQFYGSGENSAGRIEEVIQRILQPNCSQVEGRSMLQETGVRTDAPEGSESKQFVEQLAQFFSAEKLLQVDWNSDRKTLVSTFQAQGNESSGPQVVETDALNPQLPFGDAAFDTVFNLASLNCVNETALAGWLKELCRVANKNLWVALEVAAGRDRGWWETRFFEAGFRKHPRSQEILPYESLDQENCQITLIFEKIPAAAVARYPMTALEAERDLHMDMLRESGRRSDAHIARYTLARESLKPGMVVLDVACGLGYGAATMAAKTGIARIIGMDLSEWAVEYARANYGAGLPQFDFHAGDATKLSFLADASVDAVVSFETLEHLPNPDRLLQEFSRVLKPGGLFIGSVPNLWIDEQGRNPVPYHLHIYDHAQFREQVAKYFEWQALYRQNAGGGWKKPQGRLLRLIERLHPTNADLQDAEWWIGVANKPVVKADPVQAEASACLTSKSTPGHPGEDEALLPHTTLNPTTRIVVLDEEQRHQELYGRVFEELGIRPESGGEQSTEQIFASKPDAILLSREWSRPWRLIAAAARRANVPVIYVMDGVIEWSYVWNNLSFVKPEGTVLQPLLASHLCVVGRHPARILAGLGLADRIHVVGLPRLDSFSRTRTITSGQKPRILIATAKTFAHNVEHKTLVRRALRDLKNWFEANPFVLPVWRIAEEVADEIGVQPQRVGTFDEALAEASCTISFSSTCLIESMLKGLPTAQLDYRTVPLYIQAAWEIRCAEHIPGVIQELLYPPPEKLAFQEQCLEDELEPGNASERLAQVICQAITDARNPASQRSSPAAEFRRLDFHQVHSQLSAFSASPHAQLQYELDALQNLYDRVRQELRAARQELQTTRPQKAAEADRLDKLCREQTQTIGDLDKICRKRLQTIEQLDRLARERQCTIDNLDKQLREGSLPGATAPVAPAASASVPPPVPPVCCDGELKALKASLKAQPKDAGSWVKLGVIYREMSQLAECDAALQEALYLDPSNEHALLETGRTHLQQKRRWEAASCFERVEEINPRQVQTILLMAQYEEISGDPVAARLDYLRALKLDPENAVAKVRIAAIEAGAVAAGPLNLKTK